MDLVEILRDAQSKVGATKPLVLKAKQIEADQSSSMANDIMEESKGPVSKRPRVKKSEFEQVMSDEVKGDGWHRAIDQMWRGVRGHEVISDDHLALVLW